MKVAILTFAVTNNYGATLQCYALQEFLRNQGHETLILNVPLQKAGGARKVRTFIDRVKGKLNPLYCMVWGQKEGRYYRSKRESLIDHAFEAANMRLFDMFRQKYFYSITHPYIIEDDFLKDYPEADAYVVGSDQVWNPWVTNFQYPIFFLSFVKSGRKKISYAACMGGDRNFEFTYEESTTIKKLINEFNSVSVRDKTAISILKNKFHFEAIEVLDPTFLIDNSLYNKVIDDSNLDATGCMFCFKFIINDAWSKIIKDMASEMNLSIRMDSCVIPINGLPFQPTCSVADWLKLIKTSEFVFTDSFHGMVFCILFRKNFVATPSYKGGEERYLDLARKFGLENRVYTSMKDMVESKKIWMQPINYDDVYEKLEPLRKQSVSFLLNALNY